MPKISVVEAKIRSVERFTVSFYRNGTNVRGDKEDIPQYRFFNAAPSSWTVSEWKSNRFNMCYPGYDVEVYTKSGTKAAGNMKLSTVRGDE